MQLQLQGLFAPSSSLTLEPLSSLPWLQELYLASLAQLELFVAGLVLVQHNQRA